MEPKIVVVYSEDTKELLACIPLENDAKGILKTGVGFRIYGDAEPCFVDDKGVMKVSDSFTIVLD